jgi:hypothetical protein
MQKFVFAPHASSAVTTTATGPRHVIAQATHSSNADAAGVWL